MGIDEASKLASGNAGVWGIAQAIWGRKVWGTKFVKLLFGASHHPPKKEYSISQSTQHRSRCA